MELMKGCHLNAKHGENEIAARDVLRCIGGKYIAAYRVKDFNLEKVRFVQFQLEISPFLV